MCKKWNGGMICSKLKIDIQQHKHSRAIDHSGIGIGKRKQQVVRDVHEAERWADLLQDEDRRPAALALTVYQS